MISIETLFRGESRVGSLVIRQLRVLQGVNIVADFKNFLRLAYGDGICTFSKGHTPRALWDAPYGWPYLGDAEGGSKRPNIKGNDWNVFIEPLLDRLSHFRLFLHPPSSPTAFSANINFRFLSLSWVGGSYPQTTQGGVLP